VFIGYLIYISVLSDERHCSWAACLHHDDDDDDCRYCRNYYYNLCYFAQSAKYIDCLIYGALILT